MNLLLILSAIPEEQKGLEKWNQKQIQLWGQSNLIILLPIGIGKLNALWNLSRWYYEVYKLKFNNYNMEILFIGSCGIYKQKYNEEIIYSNQFINYDYPSIYSKSKFFPVISGMITTHIGSFAKNLINYYQWNGGIVNTTDSVTLTRILDKKFYNIIDKKNIDLYENLEVYGIAKFALEVNVPFTAILGVTNTINKKSSEQWEKNYKKIAKKLNGLLENYFNSILI